MGLAKLKTKISVEDYLAGEETSPVRYEYVYGEVYAMAGTSDNHNRIVGSIYAALFNNLRNSPCEPFMGDIKVRVSPQVYYYPDVLVSCEENPENPYFRNQPILIVEVLSSSTESYDRGGKFAHYQSIESLIEYVLISQTQPRIECFTKDGDGGDKWIYRKADSLEASVELESIKGRLALADVFANVDFEQARSKADRSRPLA